ncbi:MAG: hypothetical protein M1837_002900 [Sclerophora amabilis]|nr:MAG: hypothetical protein M1837_002900 [Sclerophora amabilis]
MRKTPRGVRDSILATAGTPRTSWPFAFNRSFHEQGKINSVLDRNKGDRERVVILGSGWGGYILARQLDPQKFQTLIISPRSYFAFTPLLASTSVGTLEFGCATEAIRKHNSHIEFYQGWADDVDFNRKTLTVEDAVVDPNAGVALAGERHGGDEAKQQETLKRKNLKGQLFEVDYDKLVISVGCYSQTFGTKGVKENALFLKDVGDARRIRRRILECFESAALPTTSDTLRKQLLNFAIIGGGPTGVEFSAELSDLVREDLLKIYPTLKPYVRITVYDVASQILSMFDSALSTYARQTFQKEGIQVKTEHHVEELRKGLPKELLDDPSIKDAEGVLTLKTKEDGEVGVGMAVWSTGLMANPFIEKSLGKSWKPRADLMTVTILGKTDPASVDWAMKKDSRSGSVVTDDRLRVQLLPVRGEKEEPETKATMRDVFALGDCAILENVALPATAQVANQKAKWLGKRLNKGDFDTQAFAFKNLGAMAYLGSRRAAVGTGNDKEITGRAAWLLWRSAYVGLAVSWRNRILIPVYWFINWVFGRNISRY